MYESARTGVREGQIKVWHHQAQTKVSYCTDQRYVVTKVRVSNATDPQQWSVAEVQEWLKSVVYEYKLLHVDTSVFKMDGKQLTDMTVERFLELEPKTGDILYELLQASEN